MKDHLCKHCGTFGDEHTDDKKCLYIPTYFDAVLCAHCKEPLFKDPTLLNVPAEMRRTVSLHHDCVQHFYGKISIAGPA